MPTAAIDMTVVTKTAAPSTYLYTDALNPKESVAAQGLSSFAFVAGPHSARRAPPDHPTLTIPAFALQLIFLIDLGFPFSR